MKSAATGRETAAWHFVNIESAAKAMIQRRDCPKDNCVVRQIEREMRTAARSARALRGARVEALRFLIHFVGDLHQPLHAADRHDKGGNAFTVYEGRKRSNLHRVWDEDLVEALGPDPDGSRGRYRGRAFAGRRERAAWRGTPADWANESFQVAAREIYARLPATGPVRLPRDYASREAPWCASNWRGRDCAWRCCSTRFIASSDHAARDFSSRLAIISRTIG